MPFALLRVHLVRYTLPSSQPSPVAPLGRGSTIAEWLLIVVVFFLFAGGRPPAINEAHYLAKAKHYWNPQWLAGDSFLESADAHVVFYWSVGWLTRFMSLAATAWVGRAATWCLLAWAWQRLCRAAFETSTERLPFGLSTLLAALFATAMEWLPMAGEWILGGVEAKGFAYALVLLALEAMLCQRWARVWLCVGGASAFHVLVGGWTGVACGAAWLVFAPWREWRSQVLPLAAGVALSLPGLLPALWLNWGAPAEVAAEANRIYVFERLPHHLVLHTFDWPFVARFAGATLAWLACAWIVRRVRPLFRLNVFVAASLAIALAGAAIDFALRSRPDGAAEWLRFYFFRLSDFAVPLGLVFSLAGVVQDGVLWRRRERHRGRSLQGAIAFALLAVVAFAGMGLKLYDRFVDPRPAAERVLTANRSFAREETMHKYEDWLRVCRWARENTPAESRFLTPQHQQSFKWRAERSEIVNWKDVPQDAASIVAWRRTFLEVYPRAVRIGGVFQHSDARLAELGREYDAEYLLVDLSQGARETTLPRLYPLAGQREGYYAVYRLTP